MDKGLWKWISSSAIVASMCCLPSVIMVMFGLASVSTSAAFLIHYTGEVATGGSGQQCWVLPDFGYSRPCIVL